MSESPVAIGEILADKYRVEAILGHGGMGVVVAAWHLELEQRFAMKFLLPRLAENQEAAERFRREARASARILSEHVARVVDVGTMNGGVPFMVMEYLEGNDLSHELERVGAFEVADAVSYVLQACVALAEAHNKNIVHRDLKPANLFLAARPDGTRLVKVLDFGISKSLGGTYGSQLSLTRTAALVGSPFYMSPEQLESAKDADARSDLWSLGVILFELLTGKVPFSGESMPQLVRSVLAGTVEPVTALRPDVPEALSEAVLRCLRQDPAQRFANVAELARAIAPFTIDGERYARTIHAVLSAENVSGMSRPRRSNPEAPRYSTPASEELVPGVAGPHRAAVTKRAAGLKAALDDAAMDSMDIDVSRGGTEVINSSSGLGSAGQSGIGQGNSRQSSDAPNTGALVAGASSAAGERVEQRTQNTNPEQRSSSLPDTADRIAPIALDESSAKSWGRTDGVKKASPRRPFVVLGLAGALGVAGIIYGLTLSSPPEDNALTLEPAGAAQAVNATAVTAAGALEPASPAAQANADSLPYLGASGAAASSSAASSASSVSPAGAAPQINALPAVNTVALGTGAASPSVGAAAPTPPSVRPVLPAPPSVHVVAVTPTAATPLPTPKSVAPTPAAPTAAASAAGFTNFGGRR
jgi:eukaryotic-like serine/threonine-protein kinase